ncbi:hypothetical protein EB796_001167 [Bugula neritina]|uniref:DUF1330 domain-containing protein n=1 Tax=Bugula neritina TaxID=10212 RepID=A0A7J7KQR5_BUGNE|nr:hypothetical protein EB796_001167 [Bugula neritina]
MMAAWFAQLQRLYIYFTVTPIEGNWRTNRTVAILHFATARQATSYLQSEPLVKQPDFMDGMDVCIVQAKGYPPRGKDLFVLADVNVYDTRRFAEEYVPQTAEIKNNGQVFVSAACHNPINHRGTWRPSLIILNQWGSEADYYSFYNSADYQPLKELRQRITNSNVISIMHKYE